jgi:hypothetical protein
VRRVSETVRITDFQSDSYSQQFGKVKCQKSGVFRDMGIGLKTLSEEGLLHMGVVKAPLCNMVENYIV